MGSVEQHGPHLPLNTDLVLAEALTARIVERFGERHDLWQLPALPIGLSREHDWAPGTLSLSVAGMTTLLRELARELVRALPSRNLLIVNGRIVDGSGSPWYRADLGIRGGAIAAIGIHSSLLKGKLPLTLGAVTPTMVTGCRCT